MADTYQYVTADGTPVDWATDVVDGVAQVDIYEMHTPEFVAGTVRTVFHRAGQPVDAHKLAAARVAGSDAVMQRTSPFIPAGDVSAVVVLSEAEYDALTPVDGVLYLKTE